MKKGPWILQPIWVRRNEAGVIVDFDFSGNIPPGASLPENLVEKPTTKEAAGHK